MFYLFEITIPAAIETFLFAIPETVGLLAFGVGLVVIAVLIRSFLKRGDKQEPDKKVTKEA